MSLEILTAGMLALRGASFLRQLLQRDNVQEAAGQLEGATSLSESEFTDLLGKMLGAAETGAEDGGSTAPVTREDAILTALRRGGEALSPLLFQSLDDDGNGALEGEELEGVRDLVDRVAGALGPDEADAVNEAAAEVLA